MTATAEPTTGTELKDGRVVAIAGPVVDVEFPPDALPEINHAIEMEIELEGEAIRIVAEVLCDLERDLGRFIADDDGGLQRVVDVGDRVVRELDVDDGARDAGDAPDDGGGRLLSGEAHGFFSFVWSICPTPERRRRRRSRRSAA